MSEENEGKKLIFDEKAQQILQDSATKLLASVPEVRSVTCILDFYGPLNDSPDIRKGLWVGDGTNGAISLDGAFGSMLQTLKVFEQQFAYSVQLIQSMKAEAAEIGQELVELRKEKEALQGGRQDPGEDSQ